MSNSESDVCENSVQPKPNFYAIIPANVRYCKDIEPSAKLLYGELTALCNQYGYCWACNRYLAELYDVDMRTIQRWLNSLKEKEFIFIDVVRNGFQTIRKIFISKEIFAERQNCHDEKIGTTKMSFEVDKNVMHNTKQHNTKHVVVVSAQESATFQSIDDVYFLANNMKYDWSNYEIEEAWKRYKKSKYPITNPENFIAGIIKKLRTPIKTQNKEKPLCPKQDNLPKQKSENANAFYSENDTRERPLARFARLNGFK